jgi:regulator of sirC expression with transglutaminase-like and TPR domain
MIILDPVRCLARLLIRLTLGDAPSFVDPLSSEPVTYERSERAIRIAQCEPAPIDVERLAEDVVHASDPEHRAYLMARLVAAYQKELMLARATSYLLGKTMIRPARTSSPRPKGGSARWLP